LQQWIVPSLQTSLLQPTENFQKYLDWFEICLSFPDTVGE
jgi:hypothetical protein